MTSTKPGGIDRATAVTRVNEFQSKAGQDRTLRENLERIVSVIRAAAGCQSCVLLSGIDDPNHFVIIEVWESTDAHKSAAKAIPAGEIQKVMPLLATPPRGKFFE